MVFVSGPIGRVPIHQTMNRDVSCFLHKLLGWKPTRRMAQISSDCIWCCSAIIVSPSLWIHTSRWLQFFSPQIDRLCATVCVQDPSQTPDAVQLDSMTLHSYIEQHAWTAGLRSMLGFFFLHICGDLWQNTRYLWWNGITFHWKLNGEQKCMCLLRKKKYS